MRTYPVRRPLCALVCAFIAGLWLGGPTAPSSFLLLALFAIVGMVGALFFMPWQKDKRLLLILPAFVLGFTYMHISSVQSEALLPQVGEDVRVVAEVVSAPEDKTYVDARLTYVNDKHYTHPVKVRIKRAWADHTDYTVQGRYCFSGELATPEIQTNPGGYDEAQTLLSRGIRTILVAREEGELLSPPSGFMAKINLFHDKANVILAQFLNDGEQALIRATLFSDTANLNDDFYNASQAYGIIHIFSVSGLHIGFILAFVLGLARLVHRQHSWWLILVLIPLLSIYVALSNLSPSALRASIMALLALLCARFLRYRDPFTIIALTAMGLLIAEPYNLWRIGFQLSFAAVLGIYLLTPRLEQALNRLPEWLRSSLSVALAAELFTFPLSAWYFYLFSPLSIVMNLLIVPLFSILVPLSLVAILLSALFPMLGGLVFLPVHVLIDTILALMNIIHHFVGTLHMYIGQPPLWLIILYMFVLLGIFLRKKHSPQGQLFSVGLTLICAIAILICPAVSRDLRLTVVDVGQGSGATYQTANGDWLVFDTGPSADTMARYLRYCGVNTIKGVVLSHADSDHITGLAHVLRDFRVRKVFASEMAQSSEEWQSLAPYLSHTEVVTIANTARYTLDDVTLSLALVNKTTNPDEANGNQLTTLLTENSLRILFPGDVDSDHLNELPQTSDLTVLLMPHHGSKYSRNENYFQSHKPRLAIASAGRNNRFGHPHEETIQGFSALGVPTLCTNTQGAIRLYNHKDNLRIRSYIN